MIIIVTHSLFNRYSTNRAKTADHRTVPRQPVQYPLAATTCLPLATATCLRTAAYHLPNTCHLLTTDSHGVGLVHGAKLRGPAHKQSARALTAGNSAMGVAPPHLGTKLMLQSNDLLNFAVIQHHFALRFLTDFRIVGNYNNCRTFLM